MPVGLLQMSRSKHDCAFLFLHCRASTRLAAHDKSHEASKSFASACSHVLLSVAGTPVIRCVWDLACSFTVVRFICCVCLRTEVLLKSRKMAANAYIYIYIYIYMYCAVDYADDTYSALLFRVLPHRAVGSTACAPVP